VLLSATIWIHKCTLWDCLPVLPESSILEKCALSIVNKVLLFDKTTGDCHFLFLLKEKGGRLPSSLIAISSVFYSPGASDKPLTISSIFY
jgi:hypothetical protein